jgi:hyperosmotically inducible protein
MKSPLIKSVLLGAALLAAPVLAATPDGLITSKAKLALVTTANVRSSAVHVDTNEGVVTLYGKVPTAEQKVLAEKTARDIMGVQDVKNLLQVVSDADAKPVARADKDIKSNIETALKADPMVKESSISVKAVDKGVVMLSGNAKSVSAHLRAVTIADRQPGVARVVSEIKGPDTFASDERLSFHNDTSAKAPAKSTGASDMRISGAVKLRLLTAANIPSTEISVDTDDRVVTLFGMVPSAEVSQAAAREARNVDGVAEVRNNLEVVPSSLRKVVDAKDTDISRDLGLAYKGKDEFKSVKTDVKNGTVRLTGTVNSGWDEVNAIRIADRVAGVRSVENMLKVEGGRSTESSSRD